MNVLRHLRKPANTLLICGTLTLPQAGFGQKYFIADLGSNSWSYSEAHAISGLGNVVGEYEATNSISVAAFLYTSGVMTDLGNLPGTPYAIAYGINDTNAVVGESDTAVNTHAFLWVNGAMKDLGTLGTMGGYSSAHAINPAGTIVGEASLMDQSVIHAARFDGSVKSDLGALGGDYSSASALNSSGVIVGESDVVSQGVTNVHAFLFNNGPMQDLGTLGGGYSSAKGINDSDVIVGEAETVIGGATYLRAFIYQNGTMSGLGTFGGSSSSASAINSAGQIVGYATDLNEVSWAFLYDGSNMLNLMNLIPPGSGWTNLTSADAINDAGQIAGSGYLADGSYHGYLLTPVASVVPVTLLSPTWLGSSFSFSFTTQTGYTYDAQYATPLAASNYWTVFSSVPGNGSVVWVTNSALSGTERYYRVAAH